MARKLSDWLEERVAELAQLLPLKSFMLVPRPGVDSLIQIRTRDGAEFRVSVEMKRGRIGHAAAEAWIARTTADPGDHRLLAAPAIGQDVADQLREQGRSFLDAVGNCFLNLGNGRLIVDLRAGRGTARRPPTGGSAPVNPRVLFTLLANPTNLRSPIREVARRSSTSHQTVATSLQRLRDEGFLARAGRSEHAWVGGRAEELVDRFVATWRALLRPRLFVTALTTEQTAEQDEAAIERILVREAASFGFGGSAGAQRLKPYYRGAMTVVHLGTEWKPEWTRELRAAPSRDGALTVLQTIGEDDLDSGPLCAHPLLLYAELQTSTDAREREFARELLPSVLERIATEP